MSQMKTIYKYPIPNIRRQVVNLPKGSRVLSAIEQRNEIVLYAEVDTDLTDTDPMRVLIMGTGRPFPDDEDTEYHYLGTVSTYSGDLIWQVYIDSTRPVK